MKKYLFIGAGPANIFPVLHLLDSGEDCAITIVDKGDSFDSGVRTHLLFGFAGAGLKSDGKMVFSPHVDRSHTSINDRLKCHAIIRGYVDKFCHGLNIGISKPSGSIPDVLSAKMLEEDVELLQSEVVHIGTDNNAIFSKRMYDYMKSHGVEFLWKHEFVDADLDKNCAYVMNAGRTITLSYDHLQIGLGKTGAKCMMDFSYRKGIPMDGGTVNIGGRMEFPMLPDVYKMAEVQYDYKLFRPFVNRGAEGNVRTFCTNNRSAYVIKEPIEVDGKTVTTFNGHAYGNQEDKINNISNTAIIVRLDGHKDSLSYHNVILKRFMELGNKAGVVLEGKNCSYSSSLDTTAMLKITEKELRHIFPIPIFEEFMNFASSVDKILGLNGNYRIFLPEVKMAVGRYSVGQDYRFFKYRNASFVGDCTSGAVGIVPSAVTGLMGINALNKVYEQD